jgi:hypothetical protein
VGSLRANKIRSTRASCGPTEGLALADTVVNDAIAAHQEVFGVLTDDEQQTLRELLGRVVEKGTGHELFTDHVET